MANQGAAAPGAIVSPVGATTAPAADRKVAFEQNRLLGRGVNLGNALEAPREGEWGVTLKAEYFRLIRDAGFDAVRIPIRWSAHAGEAAPYTIAPAFLERVDWAIDQALSQGLQVIINVHHYEELVADPRGHSARFLGLWSQIAAHYKDYPDDLVFELLNEPNGELRPSVWNDLLLQTLELVRKTNPDRKVIVGPGYWNSIGALQLLRLPEGDDHIIVTVHYYSPFEFTHQGAEWVTESAPWLGTTWTGSETEKDAINKDFAQAASWADRNNRPLFLGEFGAYSRADMPSRARWTAYIARKAEEHAMSWSYWEFCAGFGVYDQSKQAWNDPLLGALLPPEE
jgi:endoglucanase